MELDSMHLGGLLGFFVTLLLFFGVEFHLTRRRTSQVARGVVAWAVVSAIGEGATAVGLLATWLTMFLPPDAEVVDTWVVFVTGSVAAGCAVLLTAETVIKRTIAVSRAGDGAEPDTGG